MRSPSSETIGLYETMVRMRATEVVQNEWWQQGLISGEMHSGIGEEGIVAGVCAHLRTGDAVACDHRPTGAFVARGVDVTALFLELLGHAEGLGGGRAGHMHLMDRDNLLVADGIVGATGPSACGFALGAEMLRPGAVAVAFFGEGALNQGMLMESLNLASVWRLPVLFVCKDNKWSITTRSSRLTAGTPTERASSFGIRTKSVRGADVEAVNRVLGRLVDRVRADGGPAFVHAHCLRPDGHLLGDPLLRFMGDPGGQLVELGRPLADAARQPGGASAVDRARAMSGLGGRMATATLAQARRRSSDPVRRMRRRLGAEVADPIDARIGAEVTEAAERALRIAGIPA